MNEMKKVILTLVVAVLATSGMAQSDCGELLDANQDGLIGVEDLMNLLSHFGDSDVDFDGVFDSVDMCTDDNACNYTANPSEACIFEADAIGECGGACAEDSNEDGICDVFFGPCQGETFVDYQGYNYDLVEIGDQCWFSENLKASNFSNGDIIPLSSIEELIDEEGAPYKIAYDDDSLNVQEYGYLYSWYATADSRGVCPVGWHVPSILEFEYLFDQVGGANTAAFELKAEPPAWNGANSYGYTALPAGYFNLVEDDADNGPIFFFMNDYGYFWTNTSSGPNSAYYVLLRQQNSHAEMYPSNGNLAEDGMSVRCVRDPQ